MAPRKCVLENAAKTYRTGSSAIIISCCVGDKFSWVVCTDLKQNQYCNSKTDLMSFSQSDGLWRLNADAVTIIASFDLVETREFGAYRCYIRSWHGRCSFPRRAQIGELVQRHFPLEERKNVVDNFGYPFGSLVGRSTFQRGRRIDPSTPRCRSCSPGY